MWTAWAKGTHVLLIPYRLPLTVLLWQRNLALDATQRRLLDVPAAVLGHDLLVREPRLASILAVATFSANNLLHKFALDGPLVPLGCVGDTYAADGHEARHLLAGWEDGFYFHGAGEDSSQRTPEGSDLSLRSSLAA